MLSARIPLDENARLEALHRYEILDTPAEVDFDDLTLLAAQICGAPIALVSLVDAGRQWFKSKVGLDATENPRTTSFCAHAILGQEVFEIPNALDDERFRYNPLVTNAPNIRFYAGAPLTTPGGQNIGTLCVIDRVKRQLTREQSDALARLGHQVITQLEFRLTNRRLVEQASFQQTLLDSVPSAIISSTAEGVITHFNPSAERMLGWTREEMIGRLTSAVFHDPAEVAARAVELSRELGRDIPPGFEVFVSKVRAGAMETREWTYVRKDGSRFPVLLSLSSLRDPAGNITGFIGIARDISELKRTHAKLESSQRELLDLAENANVAMHRVDGNGIILWANQAELDLLGYTREEYFGQSITRFHADAQVIGDILERLGNRQMLSFYEARLLAKDKSIKTVSIHSSVYLENGEFKHTRCFSLDITSRKQGEARLAAAQKELNDVKVAFDQHSIVAVTDAKGKITFVNDKFCAISKYSREELLGQDHRIINSGHHPKAFIRDLWTTIAQGRVWKGELKNRAKDGSLYWVSTTIVSFLNADGKPHQFVAIRTDITEQKRASDELVQAKEAAERANRSKSDFLANMSHEIRTPMNGVIGMTGLLLDTELNPSQRDFAETIRSSADSLLTLINAILDFSKIESGKLDLEILDFDLREVLEGTVELLAKQARSKDIRLTHSLSPGVPPQLRGDQGRLRQILTNLVGNAVKFTERGEVVVRVAKESETDAHATLRFEVKDTGLGIAPGAQARLFQSFTQADSSTTRKYGGSGLGLAICLQLVELMQGKIGVTSELGKGSTFWFTLQLEKQPADAMPTETDSRDLRGVRILVVDDSAANRKILSNQIYAWKMQQGSAASGREALDILTKAAAIGAPYDLALLDMNMAEMDGLTLARAIKDHPAIASTRLIIMSWLGQQPGTAELTGAGIEAFLLKPVKQSSLFENLVKAMGRKTADERARIASPSASSATPPSPPPESPSLKIRILLAEDNAVNHKVALLQLHKLGYSADAVANGLEVLEAMQRIPYAVILMDCQMPEMDGYEATKELRRRESEPSQTALRRAPVHIIALTANAMQGDREKCLAAGMNDYVSKPARAAELKTALDRWQPPPRSVEAPSPSLPLPTPEPNPLGTREAPVVLAIDTASASEKEEARPLDLERWQDITEGDPGVMRELVGLYFKQADVLITELGEAVRSRSAPEVKRVAHKFGGASSTCGMIAIVPTLRKLEELGTEDRLAEADAFYEEALRQLERTRAFFNQTPPW